MENTVEKMEISTLKAHILWSLDLTDPINVRDLDFREWYPTLQENFFNITDKSISGFRRKFKHVSEEGFITTWEDHVDEIPTSGFMLIIQDGYDKTFEDNRPEVNCRWQYNELYVL